MDHPGVYEVQLRTSKFLTSDGPGNLIPPWQGGLQTFGIWYRDWNYADANAETDGSEEEVLHDLEMTKLDRNSYSDQRPILWSTTL